MRRDKVEVLQDNLKKFKETRENSIRLLRTELSHWTRELKWLKARYVPRTKRIREVEGYISYYESWARLYCKGEGTL